MKLKKLARVFGWLSSSLAISTAASASLVWNEVGAGDSLATAEVTTSPVSTPLDRIHGTLTATAPVDSGPVYQVDLYQIRIASFATFSAMTVSPTAFDTALFLFNSSGRGVYMNDDNPADTLSTLPAGDPSGPAADDLYFLAIAFGGYGAFDAASAAVFLAGSSFTDVLGGDSTAGPLRSWTAGFAAGSESPVTYDIVLTGAAPAIPEPGSMALMLAGGVAMCLRRRNASWSPQSVIG